LRETLRLCGATPAPRVPAPVERRCAERFARFRRGREPARRSPLTAAADALAASNEERSPVQSRIGLALAALIVLVSAALGGLLASWPGALVGAALSLVAALSVARHTRRRFARRARLVARPFPDAWRKLLRDRYDHYDRLPADLRRHFDDDLRIFIAEQRVTGGRRQVTDELRILVAASAVTLSLGWPDYEWQQLSEVLLYPDDFDRDYEIGRHELGRTGTRLGHVDPLSACIARGLRGP